MPQKQFCKAKRKYNWTNASSISIQTSQEAIHVWNREASVLLHSPNIYIPNVSRESHMASVVPWTTLSRWNKREIMIFTLGAAHQEVSDGREKKNVAFLPRTSPGASGKSTASMPHLVLNDKAHLAVTSEGKSPHQWALLMGAPW